MQHAISSAAMPHRRLCGIMMTVAFLVGAGMSGNATAQSPLLGLGEAAIETADESLSARLTGILQALATSSGGPHPVDIGNARRQEGAALLAERAKLLDLRGIPLFDLWVKPYAAYWDRPTDGDVVGSTAKRGGLAVGASLPIGRRDGK